MNTYFAHHTPLHTASQKALIVFAVLFIIIAVATVYFNSNKEDL